MGLPPLQAPSVFASKSVLISITLGGLVGCGGGSDNNTVVNLASMAEPSLYIVTASGPAGVATASLNFAVLSPALVGSSSKSLSSRYGHTATLLPNGKVLIVGVGKKDTSCDIDDRGGEPNTDAQLDDPVRKTFSDTGSWKYARSHHTATMLNNGMVLIAGGREKRSVLFHVTTEIYDPAARVKVVVA